MHELTAIAVLVLMYLLPWDNPYLVGVYYVVSMCAVFYLCAAIVQRFSMRKRLGNRMPDAEALRALQKKDDVDGLE